MLLNIPEMNGNGRQRRVCESRMTISKAAVRIMLLTITIRLLSFSTQQVRVRSDRSFLFHLYRIIHLPYQNLLTSVAVQHL